MLDSIYTSKPLNVSRKNNSTNTGTNCKSSTNNTTTITCKKNATP
ncbi:42091_t:CDS:2 [Gigaspora margarita]|uniref:42091_t:CDS:1 n=1 Tax=Gigaspora margarita TaxID=4874 RepID=A0ABM8W5Z3_GIGMA|nr:42091_t:CDS:2 [Gigaspora margarita]